jgi:hypothetical protein
MKTIDLTPTWPEVGALFFTLARSKEVRAIEAGKSEFLRAFAMAGALNDLMPDLSDAQRETIHATIARELAKHGLE